MAFRPFCIALVSLGLAACGGADPAPGQAEDHAEAPDAQAKAPVLSAPPPAWTEASATIIGVDGEPIGIANLRDGPHGLLVRVEIGTEALSPGWHGLHFHQVGDCSDVGEFKRSGGHVGMIAGGHGLMNPVGPEIGDVPNIWAAADGSAGYEIFTNFIRSADISDEDGTAIIIHANEDDHISQPIGGAGPRIACGVIEPLN